jgi:hypothetical protein
MKIPHRNAVTAFALALGLGVWGVAVNYTPVNSFADGTILTAAQLNAEFAAIQTAVASKLDRSGGTLSGRVDVIGSALNTGVGGDLSTVLNVRNQGTSGSAAVFRAQDGAASNDPVVAIKGNGAGPALSVKNANNDGSLIAASNATGARFVVESDGSIRVGALGAAGAGTPSLRIDAERGTIINSVGSGLPLAYGNVTAAGLRDAFASGRTSNWTVTRTALGSYRIVLTGVTTVGEATVVTPRITGAARFATAFSSLDGGELILDIRTYNQAGTLIDTPFSFVTFKSGS